MLPRSHLQLSDPVFPFPALFLRQAPRARPETPIAGSGRNGRTRERWGVSPPQFRCSDAPALAPATSRSGFPFPALFLRQSAESQTGNANRGERKERRNARAMGGVPPQYRCSDAPAFAPATFRSGFPFPAILPAENAASQIGSAKRGERHERRNAGSGPSCRRHLLIRIDCRFGWRSGAKPRRSLLVPRPHPGAIESATWRRIV